MPPLMQLYDHVVNNTTEPTLTAVLQRKTAGIPKGTYGFMEYYCADPDCDCRRVVIIVVNEKMKQKAVINFGFDQDGPFSGPYLDQSNHQSPYAEHLLQMFVDSLNSSPMWLDRLYRHYLEVRTKVEGKPYRGKPFPKPGELVYRVMPPPDLEAEILQSLKNLRGDEGAPPMPKRRATRPQAPPSAPAAKEDQESMAALVKRYAAVGVSGLVERLLALQKDLKRYLLRNVDSGQELAKLLPELCRHSPQDDEAINAALRLLFDALNLLEEEMESGREDAKRRMEALQEALAHQVFVESEDVDLRAAVWNILVQSRVEVLPVLRRETSTMLVVPKERSDLHDLPGEEITTGIARSLQSMGVTSPFKAAEEMLQLFNLHEPEVQTALVDDMLASDNQLLRDLSALLLFHPEREVRDGVSQLLATAEGDGISPETLRRLIISRNWLPEAMRKDVDRAVTNVRKARVECAPLVRPEFITVYASTINGQGEQLFQVMAPDGAGFARCAVTLRQYGGVAEVNVDSWKGKGEVTAFVDILKKQPFFVESTPEHLDLRVCHALAEGTRVGKVPTHWLVKVAEILGRDRWRGVSLDPARELLLLWEELDAGNRKLLDDKEYTAALKASGQWQLTGSFLPSWLEADEEVTDEIRGAAKRKKADPAAAVDHLLEDAQSVRRRRWLERVVVTALLLRSCHRPPLPWHQMYHVAQALSDETVPLKEIPLMVKIAEASVAAFNSISETRQGRNSRAGTAPEAKSPS